MRKNKYVMEYIPDRDLYNAVMFARKMIRDGTDPKIANTRAARYYDYPVHDVARYVDQAAANIRLRRHPSRSH